MTTNKWTCDYKDEPWSSTNNLGSKEGKGFYTIKFNSLPYGFLSKDVWNDKNTGEILSLIISMLNDAHDLAIKEINKEDGVI